MTVSVAVIRFLKSNCRLEFQIRLPARKLEHFADEHFGSAVICDGNLVSFQLEAAVRENGYFDCVHNIVN